MSKYKLLSKVFCQMYTSGQSLNSIAQKYNCYKESVRRWLVKSGIVIRPFTGRYNTMNTFKSFLVRDDKNTDSCWGWVGPTNSKGYGHISIGGKVSLAHRISYEIYVGEIGSALVLHKCDNPICANPKHLFLGTYADNMQDMLRKDRNGNAKLTVKDVLQIRIDAYNGIRLKEISRKYKIDKDHASKIIRKVRWKCV